MANFLVEINKKYQYYKFTKLVELIFKFLYLEN